jgi:acetyl-CoA acetyltransferase family protein
MAKPDKAFARGDNTIYDTTIGWRFVNKKLPDMYYPYSMGETAENVAQKYSISREEQDKFAVLSQQKCEKATKQGSFKEEIIAVTVPDAKESVLTITTDEHPRPGTTMADLQKLKPSFRHDGTVTAGNSSGINDGAAAILIMSDYMCKKLGYKPIARYMTSAVAGVDPAYMGLGPIYASAKALERASLSIDGIDLIELNEAFAAQALACVSEMHIDPSKLNVNGGAIALGHPLGCSGARIMTTLLHEFRRRGAKTALATMCIGVGQGIATVIQSAA